MSTFFCFIIFSLFLTRIVSTKKTCIPILYYKIKLFDLQFHINQHTGDKPYQCPFCDKSFASSGNCYSHRSRMHPGRRVDGKIRRRIPVSTGALQTRPVSNNLILNPRPIAPKPSSATTPRAQQVTVKGIFKYQCNLCNHSFLKRDNFTVRLKAVFRNSLGSTLKKFMSL